MTDPLVPAECDCTDLDSFMLNVEKLMASELVAIATNEIIGACLLVWCRAWKQRPAASLPDDDRVIAAFARMPLARFKKARDEILRGFVKCTDGRLYHRTLAAEAVRAYALKVKFQNRREADAERLNKWREKQKETRVETRSETVVETRFVQEVQDVTGRDVTLRKPVEDKPKTARKRPTPLPTDFGISERVAEWAADKGYTDLPDFLEFFISKAKAKGYTYVDWDEAFMGCIREDWPEIRQHGGKQKTGNGGPQWWASNEGIDRKGRELGMQARSTESYADFKQRIFDRLNQGAH